MMEQVSDWRVDTPPLAAKPLPRVEDLSPEARAALHEFETHLRRTSRDEFPKIERWLAKDPVGNPDRHHLNIGRLEHELSDHYEALNVRPVRSARSILEMGLLFGPSAASIWPAKFNRGDLAPLLQRVSRGLGGPGAFRDRTVCTSGDRAGNRKFYPPAGQIAGRLDELDAFISDAGHPADAFTAMTTLVTLMSIHPFEDGNGRASRCIFNYMINRISIERYYLPLYELSALSRGSFIINLRRAEYLGDWNSMSAFLRNASLEFRSAIEF